MEKRALFSAPRLMSGLLTSSRSGAPHSSPLARHTAKTSRFSLALAHTRPRKQRSFVLASARPADNPNNELYWRERGWSHRPEDWGERSGSKREVAVLRAPLHNRAGQLNPSHTAWWKSRGWDSAPWRWACFEGTELEGAAHKWPAILDRLDEDNGILVLRTDGLSQEAVGGLQLIRDELCRRGRICNGALLTLSPSRNKRKSNPTIRTPTIKTYDEQQRHEDEERRRFYDEEIEQERCHDYDDDDDYDD